MIKTFYFGSVSQEELDTADMQDVFMFSGEYFYFKVTIDLDDKMLRIQDSLGRMVPIDANHYGELFGLMQNVVDIQEDYDNLMEELDAIHAFPDASFRQTETENIVTFKG